MKPQRLTEIRTLLASPEFQSWWTEIQTARTETLAAQARSDDLLAEATMLEARAEFSQRSAIDTLYQADEWGDSAGKMEARSGELENKAFRAVSDFEEERFKASELWYRQGASEKTLEEKREALSAGPNRKLETEVKALEKSHRHLQEEYQRDMQRRDQLWLEVERIWAEVADARMQEAEQKLLAKRVRRQAETLFATADQRKKHALQLKQEADQALLAFQLASAKTENILDAAKERFGCSRGKDFLYFAQKGNQKMAFCVSLLEDRESYNLEVQPLSVYSIDPQRGVGFLEPAREHPRADENDQRFENYFLQGRKGPHPSASI